MNLSLSGPMTLACCLELTLTWLPLGPDFVDAPHVNTEPHWMMVSLGDIPPTITITGVCCWLCMAVLCFPHVTQTALLPH